jgi:hypothetical protein
MMTQPAPTTALIIGPERQDSKFIVAADPEQGPCCSPSWPGWQNPRHDAGVLTDAIVDR